MTLNELYNLEKNSFLVENRKNTTPEEKQRAQADKQKAASIRAAFCEDISRKIPSREQAQVVAEEISGSSSILDTILKVRWMIKAGISYANQEHLDSSTVAALKESTEDFNRELSICVSGTAQ